MPRFTPDGRVLAGVGQGIVSRDGVVLLTHAGGWADDGTRALGPAKRADPDTWAIVDEHLAIVDPRGANTFYAGGGQWAAWLDGSGVRGTNPALPLQKAGLIAVTRQGVTVIKPDYHATGGREAYAPDGRRVLWGADRLLAAEDHWYLTETGVPNGMLIYRVCAHTGAGMATAYIHGVTVLWQLHTDRCLVLNTTEDAYHPDVININGRLRVCWSRTEGEAPGDIVVREILPSDRWVSLDSLWPAPPIIDPPSDPVDPPPPIKPEPRPMTSIVLESIAAATVTEVPHPDGHGLVGLRDTVSLLYLCVEQNGSIRWSPLMGAWEAFYPGAAYTAVREHGVAWILQKGGAWL